MNQHEHGAIAWCQSAHCSLLTLLSFSYDNLANFMMIVARKKNLKIKYQTLSQEMIKVSIHIKTHSSKYNNHHVNNSNSFIVIPLRMDLMSHDHRLLFLCYEGRGTTYPPSKGFFLHGSMKSFTAGSFKSCFLV